MLELGMISQGSRRVCVVGGGGPWISTIQDRISLQAIPNRSRFLDKSGDIRERPYVNRAGLKGNQQNVRQDQCSPEGCRIPATRIYDYVVELSPLLLDLSAENGTVRVLRTSQTGLSVRFGSNGNSGLRGALAVAIDKPNVTAG
jgi:hypothetical protein